MGTVPQTSAVDSAAIEHLYDDVKSKSTNTAQLPVASQVVATSSAAKSGTGQSSDTSQPALKGPVTSIAEIGKIGAGKSPVTNPGAIASTTLMAPHTSSTPRKVEILIKDRVFVPEGNDGALRVLYEDLDLLRVLNMDPVTGDCDKKMPEWLKQLNGKKVRMRGFMAPTFTETDITNFVMARDTQACCFGPNTKIYHLIEIHMKAGLTADYQPFRPLEVQGTFRIEPSADDGMVFHLYFIDDAEIIKKK